MKKRVPALILAVLLVLSLTATGTVAASSADATTAHADALNALGLFKGSGTGYDLDRTPNRAEALTMLIRLLGKEEEAQGGGCTHPFRDTILWWAEPYVAYGYTHGLTKGRSLEPGSEAFDCSSNVTARDYVTFLLRAMGYDDAAGDFEWRSALDMAYTVGLITLQGKEALSKKEFTRGDMVDLSYAALSRHIKRSPDTLSDTLVRAGVYTQAKAEACLDSDYVYGPVSAADKTVDYQRMTVKVASGSVTADVLTVNIANPRVSIKSVLSGDTIHDPLPFASIVANSDALAVITGNFRTIGKAPYYPIGHVMSEGVVSFTSSYHTLGITASGEMRYGRPSIQVWMRPTDQENPPMHWLARSVNVAPDEQTGNGSALYTPFFGDSVTVQLTGSATTVRNGVVTACTPVAPGAQVSIPDDGYVLLLSSDFEGLYLYQAPRPGQPVELEYRLGVEDAEGFTLEGVEFMVASSPRLVQDGQIVTTLDPTFSDSRFTGNKSPRTAVGTTADGLLIFVSVPSASTQQLRELMLALGCVDAINLDGGASTGFYYNGTTYRTPSRPLITTIQIFVD